MPTKAQVLKHWEQNGVTITYDRADVMSPVHHVHADIDVDGYVFRSHGLHNIGVWDDIVKPDWNDIWKQLESADFGPCEDMSCSYCGRD